MHGCRACRAAEKQITNARHILARHIRPKMSPHINICVCRAYGARHRENLSVQIRRSTQPIPSCHAPVPSPVSVLALPTAAKLCLRVATREPNVETHKPSCRWPRSTSCRQQATGTWRTTRCRRGHHACRPPRSDGQSPA